MAFDQRTRDMLVEQGAITGRHGLTVKARYRTCPHGCGLILLAGQWLGFELWADPWPITAKGELDATLAGRQTYTRSAMTLGLLPRLAADIREKPPQRYDVHAEHRCGQPHPAIDYARIPKRATADATSAGILPPF